MDVNDQHSVIENSAILTMSTVARQASVLTQAECCHGACKMFEVCSDGERNLTHLGPSCRLAGYRLITNILALEKATRLATHSKATSVEGDSNPSCV